MKKFAVALILISVAVIGYFTIISRPEPAPEPVVRDDVTLRSTTAGDVVGFIDKHGTRAWMGIPFAEPPSRQPALARTAAAHALVGRPRGSCSGQPSARR